MENKLASRISDSLSDQVWFQELKAKWAELPPQQQTYVKYGSILLLLLICFGWVMKSAWGVRSLKKELAEKQAIIQLIQSANDEMRRIKDTIPSSYSSGGKGDSQPWSAYFDSVATTSSIDKSALTLGSEKPGKKSDLTVESLFEISIKHISIRQAVRMMHHLENGQRPVKVRNMAIDTKADPAGYIDVTLQVSAYSLQGDDSKDSKDRGK